MRSEEEDVFGGGYPGHPAEKSHEASKAPVTPETPKAVEVQEVQAEVIKDAPVATRDFTVLIRGTIRSEEYVEGEHKKYTARRLRREIVESVMLDDRVADFEDVDVVVKK